MFNKSSDIDTQTDTLLKNKNGVTHKFHTNDHTFDVEVGTNHNKFGLLKKSTIKGRDNVIVEDQKIAAVTPNNKLKNKSSDGNSNTARIEPGKNLLTQSSDEGSEGNSEEIVDHLMNRFAGTSPAGGTQGKDDNDDIQGID